LNWSYIGENITTSFEILKVDKPYYFQVIVNIVEKGIDFFGYSILEVAKLAVFVTLDNPDIMNYKVLFILLVFSLLAPLLFPIFIILVSIFLIIKEFLEKRKEKKILRKLKEERRNNVHTKVK
jgi:hypothetical protein